MAGETQTPGFGDALKRVFSSAKVWTAIIGIACITAAYYGLNISEQMTALYSAIVAVLIGAQGAADHGKEAEKERSKVAMALGSQPGSTSTVSQVAAGDINNPSSPVERPSEAATTIPLPTVKTSVPGVKGP